MSDVDKSYTRAEMAGMVQASLALCATCSHARGEHEGDTACLAQWETTSFPDGPKGTKLVIKHTCGCQEYWPVREQREDDLRVVAYEVGFGGGVGLELNRRLPTEFWDSLKAAQLVDIHIRAEVTAKGFKRHKDGGLVELRKLSVTSLELESLDPETGELR